MVINKKEIKFEPAGNIGYDTLTPGIIRSELATVPPDDAYG